MKSQISRTSLTPLSSSSNTAVAASGNTRTSSPTKQLVLVIGGTGTIGLACAKRARDHGHPVMIVGRNTAKGEAAATQIGATFREVDLTQLSQLATFCSTLSSTPIHCLLLAAGVGPKEQSKTPIVATSSPATTENGKDDMVMMINYIAPAFIVQYFLKARTKIGRIIWVTGFQLDYQVLPPLDSPMLTLEDATRYSCSKAAGYVFVSELARRNPEQSCALLVLGPLKTPFYPDWMPTEMFSTTIKDVEDAWFEIALGPLTTKRGVPYVLRAASKTSKMQELPVFKKKDSLLFGNGDLVAELSYQADLYDATCARFSALLPTTPVIVAAPPPHVPSSSSLPKQRTSQRSSGAESTGSQKRRANGGCLVS